MHTDFRNQTAADMREALDKDDVSVLELAEASKAVIEELDKEINAFVHVREDISDDIKRAEQMIGEKKATPLTGIPIAVKDNILVKGAPATAGSKILENYTAAYDATVVKKLREAGAVIIGKTNMDEFAMGSSGEHSAFGNTKNPIDTKRVPGGSSSGSAAAVALGAVPLALGSDTGGSIRQPASFCGVVGCKPTYGAVSRYGLIALGSSLDQIGPLARTVADAESLYEVLRGNDPLDSTSLPEDFSPNRKDKSGKVVGVPESFAANRLEPDVRENFEESIAKLEKLGYEIRSVELPRVEHSLSVYYIVMPAEASTNLARYDGIRYGSYAEGDDLLGDYINTRTRGFGAEPRRRIILGTYVLSAGYYESYYGRAELLRREITNDFALAFEGVSAIAMPTTPAPAFVAGEKEDPLSMYMQDIFTVPANLAGIPAISVPSGFARRDGVDLPLGLQLMGPHGGEKLLFTIGKRFLGEMP